MLKYFLEIKSRFILLWITWLSMILVSYYYKEVLLFVLVQSNIFADKSQRLTFFYFIFTDVTEVLSVYLKLITFLSCQILYIHIVYHLFLFVSPAFFQLEYFYFKLSLKIFFFTWLFAAFLASYILIPLMWDFFLSFQHFVLVHSFNLHFEAKLEEYLCFYVSFYYLCWFYCQFFMLVLLVLSYIKLNIKIIKKFRKLYYYLFIFFSTFISPPEILSQILISLVIIFMYEFLLLIILLKSSFKFILLTKKNLKKHLIYKNPFFLER